MSFESIPARRADRITGHALSHSGARNSAATVLCLEAPSASRRMAMRRMVGVGVMLLAVLAGLGVFEVSTLKGQGTAWFEGVVKDPAGAPLAGVEVQLTGAGGWRQPRTRTDVAGKFVFPNLAPGTYTVTAHLKGFADATTTVTLGDRARQTLALIMPPAPAADAVREPTKSLDTLALQESASMPAAASAAPLPGQMPDVSRQAFRGSRL